MLETRIRKHTDSFALDLPEALPTVRGNVQQLEQVFINGDLEDRYATVGGRWLVGEWNADLSTTYGYNEMYYDISNTLNASIANFELLNQRPAVSKTAFDAGCFSIRQSTTNLDFTRYFDDLWGGTNIAFGGEYRDENYEIVAGERRWRAAQLAGLGEVPALIRNIPDEQALAMALIENIQRENLNPLEEAQGLQRLIDEFGLTHQQAADAVGRSRPAATNLLRLLQLTAAVQDMLMSSKLDMGHARPPLPLPPLYG